MKSFELFILSALMIFSTNRSYAQCNGRYETEIFSSVDITEIQYGVATQTDGSGTINLFMDVYEPTGDTAQQRPVIIFAHGGSFIGGDKSSADIVQLCNSFAKRGYVTVSIDYRLEQPLNMLNPDKMVKALIRGVHDMKASFRYFRMDEQTSNLFKVDINQIFAGGVSAGAIIAAHVAYMDSSDQIASNYLTFIDQLGGFEGESGNPDFSSAVSGVISMAGALADASWLGAWNQPIISFHSINDGTVPYGNGHAYNYSFMPVLHGSLMIDSRADTIDTYSVLYSYPGSGHPHFMSGTNIDQAIMDSTILLTSDFMYSILACNPNNVVDVEELQSENYFLIYPNPADEFIKIEFPFLNSSTGINIFNSFGQLMRTQNYSPGLSITFDIGSLAKGIYFLEISNQNVTQHQILLVQ